MLRMFVPVIVGMVALKEVLPVMVAAMPLMITEVAVSDVVPDTVVLVAVPLKEVSWFKLLNSPPLVPVTAVPLSVVSANLFPAGS